VWQQKDIIWNAKCSKASQGKAKKNFFYSATYFKSRTTMASADMLQAHQNFILNLYAFLAADFLSWYRKGIWYSSSANKQVLQATCSNPTVNIPHADPVTEHRYNIKCNRHISYLF
jgi:hypothetical protein